MTSSTKIGFEWIRARESGITYLCPAGSVRDKRTVTEAELREIGVDESQNPQND